MYYSVFDVGDVVGMLVLVIMDDDSTRGNLATLELVGLIGIESQQRSDRQGDAWLARCKGVTNSTLTATSGLAEKHRTTLDVGRELLEEVSQHLFLERKWLVAKELVERGIGKLTCKFGDTSAAKEGREKAMVSRSVENDKGEGEKRRTS
jgi:hypothetical protein